MFRQNGRGALFGVMLAGAASPALADTFGYTGDFNVDNDMIAVEFTVSASSPVVVLRNWGYGGTHAGGVAVDSLNGVAGAASMESTAGNFDSLIQVFNSNGDLVFSNDNTLYQGTTTSDVQALEVATAYTESQGNEPYSRWQDAELRLLVGTGTGMIEAGVYTLVLSQQSNTYVSGDAYGAGAVYAADGQPTYTTENPSGVDNFPYACSTGYFCDVVAYDQFTGYNRESGYALEIYGVDSASLVYDSTEGTSPTTVPLPGALPMAVAALASFGVLRSRRRGEG